MGGQFIRTVDTIPAPRLSTEAGLQWLSVTTGAERWSVAVGASRGVSTCVERGSRLLT